MDHPPTPTPHLGQGDLAMTAPQPWQSTRGDDIEDAPCQRCGTDVHLHNDPPCPHGYVACTGCGWEAICRDCHKQAEAEMFATGIYNPNVDTSMDNTPEALARRAKWEADLAAFTSDTATYYQKGKP